MQYDNHVSDEVVTSCESVFSQRPFCPSCVEKRTSQATHQTKLRLFWVLVLQNLSAVSQFHQAFVQYSGVFTHFVHDSSFSVCCSP